MVASGPASHSALIIAALVTAVGTLPVSYFPTTSYSEKCLCMLNYKNVAIEVKAAEVHSCIPYIIGIQSQAFPCQALLHRSCDACLVCCHTQNITQWRDSSV